MITEVYIEKRRLDITNDISTLLTFGLDDIKDFSSRSTSFSKTIVLPGTANNNKLFGHIFQIGQSNTYNSSVDNVGYNFNSSKSADCIIFQDQIQTFIGVLRLMQINVSKGRIEYEVAVFGKIASLNVALSSYLLEDLDFSSYDHDYTTTNIINSWDNTGGSGYYYPHIDYGQYSVDKHDWDYHTFRPALYVKEYIDKMFSAAGFRYDSDLIDTSRFKSLVIPHNQKTLNKLTSSYISNAYSNPANILLGDGIDPPGDKSSIYMVSATVAGNFDDFATGGYFVYNGATPLTVSFSFTVHGTINSDSSAGFYIGVKSGTTDDYSTTQFISYASLFHPGTADPVDFTHVITGIKTLTTGQELRLYTCSDSPMGSSVVFSVNVTVDEFKVFSTIPTLVPANLGDGLTINDTIPKNIRQIDFLVSIVKLFNLYVWEDKFDPNLIYIKPYIDFYTTDSADSNDWTYKLNRNKTLQIKPMSELNAKKYEFKYKSDSDFWNETYRKRYGQGYGDYVFDSQFEFAEQTKAFELIFSATTLVGVSGEDKVYSTIYKQSNSIEEQVDSNIRILQTKKITGVTSWDILDVGTPLTSLTKYGYAGHFDDPDDPTNDLNFGVTRELFFTLVGGNLTATQFNVYWSGYMAEITDKDSKLLTAYFYLTPKDIFDLDFSKFIYLDGVLFRLVKIEDYNSTKPAECKVELLKVNYLIY